MTLTNSSFFKTTKIISVLIIAFLLIAKSIPITQVYAASPGINDINIGFSPSGDINYEGIQTSSGQDAWNNIINKYRSFILGFSGIATFTMILFFIYNFVKLGSTSDNDSARAKVIKGLIFSALAAAGLGSVSIIFGFFFNALND